MSQPFKVSLAGSYNTRVSAVNASDSSSGYVGVGIVGLMIVGKTSASTTKDARYINCFMETVSDPATGKRRVYMVKRPGFATSITPSAGNQGYSILIWTGMTNKIITAFGSTNSTIFDSSSSLGAITGRSTGITETFVGTTATLVVSSNDSTGWVYDTGLGVMTKISDGDFPGNAGFTTTGTFAHLDGFACIATTDGKLWASDLNSVTSWTANSFDSANAYPDPGIGIVRFKNFIMYFGTESIQFFYNAGLVPFPFAKAVAMTQKVGAVSADVIATIADNVFWCGSTPQGGLQIFQFSGTLSPISTPEINAILILAGASNISLTTIRFYGRSFVLVRASTTTFAYCLEEKMWHEWNSTTPLWYKVAGISQGSTMVNYAISNVSTDGKVYVMNHASLVFTDDTATYTARVQTPGDDMGTNAIKTFAWVDVVGDTEDTASTLTISTSDDDFASYQVLGTVDLSDTMRRLSRCGSARKRSWVLTHSAATPMRLERLEGRMNVGNN